MHTYFKYALQRMKLAYVVFQHYGPVFLVCIVMSDEFTKRLVIKRKSTCA